MAVITIDNRTIEVPAGTKVLAAAEKLGIMIPRFCHHPALGSLGACRLCAVKFLEGPVKGIQMSCMVEAKDGMVVSTTDPEAVDFRKHVIEWLMQNHPHDCPVCDEGGHCLLQDMTVSGGHGHRRYEGKKRTYEDQDLGPLLSHEMNRCIHCYRCVRFYREFSGYRDIGTMGSADRTYFGRFTDGPLESPFAGNLADICPTGVFMDKPSRFKGRRWDYERRPSLCIHCSLGCHTWVSARYREIVRTEARYSKEVNGHFICDRGRYGFAYAEHPDRPRKPRIGSSAVPLTDALSSAREKLSEIAQAHGPGSIACISSFRSTLETQIAAKRLCDKRHWTGPVFFTSRSQANKAMEVLSIHTPSATLSLGALPEADAVLVVGGDPVNEAPMLALAIRQAARSGAVVTVLDPRPVFLPFDFKHIPLAPEALTEALGLISTRLAGEAVALSEELEAVSETLAKSRRPVIVCGFDVLLPGTFRKAETLVSLLKNQGKNAGLFFLLPGPNAFGAALLGDPASSLEQILDKIESGTIRALILAEETLFGTYPDPVRLTQTLEKLDFLLVLDYLPSKAADLSDIFLPTQTLFESGGLFINQEGRLQEAAAVYQGGLSITRTGKGSHPPRDYGQGLPGKVPQTAWELLVSLLPKADASPYLTREELTAWAAGRIPALSFLSSSSDIPAEGIKLDAPKLPAAAASAQPAGNGLRFIFSDQTFGSEELSLGSECLKALEALSAFLLNPQDAAALDLEEGKDALLAWGGVYLQRPLRLSEKTARGVCIIPRHGDIRWAIHPEGEAKLSPAPRESEEN